MRGAAPVFASRFSAGDRPDLLIASSMLSLAEFLGLADPLFRRVPSLLYFHENQLTYPIPDGEKRDLHLVMTQVNSGLAADRILFNSHYHREEFLKALPPAIHSFPDHRPREAVSHFQECSGVLPLGIDFDSLHKPGNTAKRDGPPVLLWNHRWEHDKGRDTFLLLLRYLRERRVDFRLIITGASKGTRSDFFEDLPPAAGEHLMHMGYVRTRSEYAKLLSMADIVLSTARHEFFGVSILEAIYSGAFPILPERLAYPEILNPKRFPDCYFRSTEELFNRVESFLRAGAPDGATIREEIARFAWPNVIPLYDRFFDEMTAEMGGDANGKGSG